MMKRAIAFCAACVMLLGLAACGSGGGGSTASANQLNAVTYPKAVDYDDWESRNENREQNAVDEEFAKSLMSFSCLSAENVLLEENGNICYSPVSLYFALALAAYGSDGETAEQLYSAMGVSDKAELAEQCGKLFRLLYNDDGLNSLLLANSLWLNGSIEFKDDYLSAASDDFYAALFNEDFSDPASAERMSKWVSDNTKGLLKPEVIVDPNNLMHIFNTVYFYSQWQDQFSESATASDTFTRADGSTVDCDFMRDGQMGSYTRGESATGYGYTVAERGLKSGSMFFILPDEGVSPAQLLDLSNSTVKAVQPALMSILSDTQSSTAMINWSVPKFSTDSTIDLVPVMKDMGVTTAFTGAADFSGMSDMPSCISAITQGTHIALDENGVEAAAYTEVTMDCTSAIMEDITLEFSLDRPFIYGVISDDGTLLFTGICADPTEK